jgi:RNA polymerase sigma-70 factor (ECF subfamily)
MKKKYAKYSDKELLPLLQGSKKQSEAVFTEFYNRYSPRIHAYCVCMVKDTLQAEDIFQETFIRFYKNISPDKEHSNVSSFLMTIARNLSINYNKNKRNNIQIETLEQVNADVQSYENKDLCEIALKMIDLLDYKYKEAFTLREIDGLKYAEIASITDTSLSNAKSRVARARQKLLGLLEPYIKQ